MSFLFPLLRSSDPTRHQKAVQGLHTGELTVNLTTHTDHEIRAIVTNGDGIEYGVHLGSFGSVCSCPDALYRNVACKHALSVCIFALQPPEVQFAPHTPIIETTHLQWRSGELLCHEPHPLRVWTWPFPVGILAHPKSWPEVSLCQTCLQTWQHPTPPPRAMVRVRTEPPAGWMGENWNLTREVAA